MRANLSILILIFFNFCQGLVAQTTADSLSRFHYANALRSIDGKDFKAADENFKKLLKLKTTLPDELAYYYGYTLIHLSNFKTGRELLKKYIALRGDTGRFYNYAQTFINLADCKETGSYFAEEACYQCHGKGMASRQCSVCHGKGMEKCPLCEGLGVIKKKDRLGDSFITCTKCNGKEFITCQSCHGTLEELYKCYVCDGLGKVKIKKECDATVINSSSDY